MMLWPLATSRMSKIVSGRMRPTVTVIPFPAFDPVLISVGPFVIRWYALAYIVGILGGWLYARALVRSRELWNDPPPLTVVDFDDFVL